jgi:dipeptidyl aminopeptidase/acylaminoacyl peptidase
VRRATLAVAIALSLCAGGSEPLSAAGQRQANGLIAYTVLFRVPGEKSPKDYIFGLCVRDLRGSSRRLTAARLRADESAAWSPDGRELAFDRTDERGRSGIMLLDAQRHLRSLSGASASDTQPTWSPDGKEIAFVQDPGDIYVMRADGTDRRLLVARTSVASYGPRWSPDGRHIAFVRGIRNGSTPSAVMLVNADGSGERKIADGTNPAWAPDSATLAYDTSTDFPSSVFLVDVDGRHRRTLTGGFAPVWSPDGRRILIGREHLRANGETASDLYVIASDGSGVRPLLRSPLYEFDPAWQSRPPGSDPFPLGVGAPCVVSGSERANRLLGSRHDDFIYGFGGRDVIRAGRGEDVVSGNEGSDVIMGGPGHDRIGGGFDPDRILGGPGNDAVFADGGADVLIGGEGSDHLFGGFGSDRLAGGRGDDVLVAVDGGRDRVSCGPGHDFARVDRRDRVTADCEDVEVVTG